MKLSCVATVAQRKGQFQANKAELVSAKILCKILQEPPITALVNDDLAQAVKVNELLPTRNSLLSRLRNWSDQEGWREFFDTYWKFLYGVAIKSGLPDEDARDVVQETVVSVAKALRRSQFRRAEGSSFKAWLKVIVRRRIVDHLRKRRLPIVRHSKGNDPHTRIDTIEQVPDPCELVGEIWDEEWVKNLADAAINRVKQRVNAKHFQIFDLYVLKGWPVGEVARTLKTSQALVYLAKHRVTRLIKRETAQLRKRMEINK